MTDIVDTVTQGDIEVEIDEWGGLHIHGLQYAEEPLSLDPSFVQRVIDAREEAL